MSKQIAQSVPGKRIAYLIAILAAVMAIGAFASQWHDARAAKPPPTVTFTKSAESPGGNVIYFTIRVENQSPINPDDGKSDTSEDNGTGTLLVQDFIPDSGSWYLLDARVFTGNDDAVGSKLDCVPSDTVIACNIENILGRHLNKKQDDFTNGYASIVIYGVLNHCGPVTNTALLLGLGPIPRSATATGEYPCPATPTPSPTPTFTPTNTPVNTPVPNTPTNTPTSVPTSTPTQIRIAPLPPNTGDSQPSDQSASDIPLYSAILGGAVLAGLAAYIGGKYMLSRRE